MSIINAANPLESDIAIYIAGSCSASMALKVCDMGLPYILFSGTVFHDSRAVEWRHPIHLVEFEAEADRIRGNGLPCTPCELAAEFIAIIQVRQRSAWDVLSAVLGHRLPAFTESNACPF